MDSTEEQVKPEETMESETDPEKQIDKANNLVTANVEIPPPHDARNTERSGAPLQSSEKMNPAIFNEVEEIQMMDQDSQKTPHHR